MVPHERSEVRVSLSTKVPTTLPYWSLIPAVCNFSSDAHSFEMFQDIQEAEGWEKRNPSLQFLRDFHQCCGAGGGVVVTVVWWVINVFVSKPNKPNWSWMEESLALSMMFYLGWRDICSHLPGKVHTIIAVFFQFPSFSRYEYLCLSFSHLSI